MNRLKKRAGIARPAIITSRSFILAGIEMHGGLRSTSAFLDIEKRDLQLKHNSGEETFDVVNCRDNYVI